MFINRCAVCSDELFVLRCVLQTHVRLEKAIEQLMFLVLPADARESSQERTRGQNSSHIIESCRSNGSFVKEIVDLPRSSIVLVNSRKLSESIVSWTVRRMECGTCIGSPLLS